MNDFNHIKAAYFVGIGGIGMSALARYCKQNGMQVFGYDKTPSALTNALQMEGMEVTFTDVVNELPSSFRKFNEAQIVVYTPSIPKDSAILNELQKQGYQLLKRAALLGLISKSHYTLAVAGTHGKTTTSTMLAHIMYQSGYQMLGILGGLSTNYNSNYLIQEEGKTINGQPILVTEADEFDRSFLHLEPNIAVITSTDADHLDIYGKAEELQKTFQLFADKVKEVVVLNEKADITSDKKLVYGKQGGSYYSAIRQDKGKQYFKAVLNNNPEVEIEAGLSGAHNIENAIAAASAALVAGVDMEQVVAGITSFKGVKRRFEKVFESATHAVIDDYAHHPEELKALIHAVRELYPNRGLTMIFQPHLYSRTRDFMEGFAEVLSTVDTVIVNPIYAARELPIAGIDSEILVNKISLKEKQVLNREEAVIWVEKHQPKLLVIAGAGDIDRIVEPITQNYLNAKSAHK